VADLVKTAKGNTLPPTLTQVSWAAANNHSF